MTTATDFFSRRRATRVRSESATLTGHVGVLVVVVSDDAVVGSGAICHVSTPCCRICVTPRLTESIIAAVVWRSRRRRRHRSGGVFGVRHHIHKIADSVSPAHDVARAETTRSSIGSDYVILGSQFSPGR